MKLEKVLDELNSFEKNPFLKIIDGIVANDPKNINQVDKILSESNRDLKAVDSINISRVFSLLEDEYASYIKAEFENVESQLDILIDIVSRDGNCIMKQDWFSRLYDNELKAIKKRVKEFKSQLESDKSDLEENRKRDYNLYLECLRTAYENDKLNNQEMKVTSDEQSILNTLGTGLELSQDEVKLINYLILPIKKKDIDEIINDLKSKGVIFYSKKNSTIYVADEVVRVLRKVRGKSVADKYIRRVLRLLREPQINLICKKHNLDWRQEIDFKIRLIIETGITLPSILINDLHKPGTTLTERKKIVNQICDKGLNIKPNLKGATIEEKVNNLIDYFEDVEKDEKVGISIDGYDKMLKDLSKTIPKLNAVIRNEFELQDENVLSSNYLLDYNIKPRDILELLTESSLNQFCQDQGIKSRGENTLNILDAYKDAENLYLENYENIAFRNLAALKENGLNIKESELGVKFEELTKKILETLGFNVDESLRKEISNKKDKMDIVINLGNNELIIIECKTVKESGYNKFSSVSRQLKAYTTQADNKGYKVIKSLLIAPEFSDEFIRDCGLEYELNLSLITAYSLQHILETFKQSKLKVFPHNLLMRDVLIQEDRIMRAISK